MILRIVVIVRILLQELEGTVAGIGGLQHLRSIAAVLLGIHHRQEPRFESDTGRDVGRDTGGHRLVALGLDDDNTVGTLGTVQGSTITHDGHFLDVRRVDG